MDDDDTLSLRENLVNWLFTPLYLLLLFSTITGYMAAVKLSNEPYDLVLIERARLLASRFDMAAGSDGGARGPMQLFPEASADFYYTLYDTRGQMLDGNIRLPKPRPADLADRSPHLRDSHIGEQKLRLLTLRHTSMHQTRGMEYVVVAAEPIAARLSLGRSILGNIVIPQFIFILIAGLAVWLGLKRGLDPLERLRRDVARRPRGDLHPLDEARTPAEVRPLIHEINRLLERLKGMLDSQRRFVADAAHQLRTPFAGLKAQAELARREPASEPVRESLERICLGAQRCSRLVNQLLALARNEPRDGAGGDIAVLDLRRVAQECALRWAPDALAKDIDLELDAPDMQLPVRGDEHALTDLFDNLLDNAIRYTPAAGHIVVTLGYAEGAWCQIADDGPGIAQAEREKVFERFYRVVGSGQAGSGLGLAIVQEVALRHGARLEISEGLNGNGTAFTLTFPHHGEIPPSPAATQARSG